MNWKHVSLEMPPNATNVLVASSALAPGGPFIAYFDQATGEWYPAESGQSVRDHYGFCDIAYWMPLPAMPTNALTGF